MILKLRIKRSLYEYFRLREPSRLLETMKEDLIRKIQEMDVRDLTYINKADDTINMEVRIFNDKEDYSL